MAPSRRQFLAGTAALAGTGLFGIVSRGLLPPAPSDVLAPRDDLARALASRLKARGVDEAFVDYDHPLRQYHNRGVAGGGTSTALLRRAEQALLVDLIHASLSEIGRERLFDQLFLGLVGLNYGRLVFCGDPNAGDYQVILTGAHLNLRMGGASREGVAFGGPQVYGDQTGDGQVGVPGNAYLDQLIAGQSLVASLSPAEQQAVRCAKAPVQTQIAVRGRFGEFDGLPVAELDATKRARVRDMIDSILQGYAPDDAAYAWQCIDENGGVEAFHVADYDVDHQGGMRFDGKPSQIFRLESPAAVFHFRAVPHLHAFFNVARDGERPLSLGDIVAVAPVPVEKSGVRRNFENVLREETGEEFAYYPTEMVAGVLREGPIREGDVWAIESWGSRVSVIEVDRSDLSSAMLEDWALTTQPLPTTDRLRLAVPDGLLPFGEHYGIAAADEVSTGRWLRDAMIDLHGKLGVEVA